MYQSQVLKERFWEITLDYLAALVGVFEQSNKNVRFCLFSAQGASPSEKSFIRFTNSNGRAENTLLISNLTEKYIFHPGFTMPGSNSQNTTLLEKLFEPIYRLFPVIGIDASEFARIMVNVSINHHDRTVNENRNLRAYGVSR